MSMRRRDFLHHTTTASLILAAPGVLRAGSQRLDRLVLQGPPSGPSLTLAHAVALGLFDDIAREVAFSCWSTPDELRANLTSGRVPVVAMAAQGAASMYNRGFGVHLVTVMTDGHCGMVSRHAPIEHITELRGQRIGQPFINDMTGHVMRRALAHYGMTVADVHLVSAATHIEGAQLLLAGRVDSALLAEPAATAALLRAEATATVLHRGLQMRDEWGRITGLRPSLPQAGLVVTQAFAEAHPQHIEALHQAVEFAAASANANPQLAAEHAAEPMDRPAAVLSAALPFCHLTARQARQARPELEAMYSALAEADPGIIGGRLPDAEFYLI